MHEKPIQEHLFQRIKEKLPPELALADSIAELLHISPDSAYRRIRGETLLVLEEARILCEAYDLSLDLLFKTRDNSILFSSVYINNGNYSFKNYLLDIRDQLKAVASFDQKEIIYLSKDFVLFYNFLFRPLFAFRYFFWMKSIVQHPDYVSLSFSTDLLTEDIEALGKEITQLYSSIPSTEIWNTEVINSYIAHIEYYREAGYFKSPEDVSKIYEALSHVLEHVRIQAETGCKFLPGENPATKKANFQFFHNRLVLGDNMIMAIVNGKKTLYLNYDVLNYMSTRDESFCNQTYSKLQTFIRRATILSNVSEKQRNMFFNTLLKKIPNRTNVFL